MKNVKKNTKKLDLEWTAKCGNCGTCAFKMTDGTYIPCDCKHFLFFTYVFRQGIIGHIDLNNKNYKVFVWHFSLRAFHRNLFALFTRWGIRKWGVVCGQFSLWLGNKNPIDYNYD